MSTPFMQLYVADYLADTQHLTTEQHGAYLLILFAMWRAGGDLDPDDSKLARIARLTVTRWNKLKGEILALLTMDDGRLTQKRLRAELRKAEEKSQKRAEAGRHGGQAKALKDNEPRLANASSLPKHSSEPEPEPEPEPESEEESKKVLAASPRQGDLLSPNEPPPQSQIAVVEVVFDPLERAREAYNEAVDAARERYGADWTACQNLNETRKKQLAKRLKECGGVQAWAELMQRATESPHLNGTAPRKPEFASWWPDFDFFLQPKSFTKLMEGSYDPKSGKAAASGGGSFLEAAGRVAARHSAGGS